MRANRSITKNMAGRGRRNRRSSALLSHRKDGQPTFDRREKIKIATPVRIKQTAYPRAPSEWNRESSQPIATDQEETSTHTAARCKVDNFLTPMFIAEFIR